MPTVRELRIAQGWSQRVLAEKANLTIQTISSMERGYPVQRSTVALVAMALGVQFDEITGVKITDQVTKRSSNDQ